MRLALTLVLLTKTIFMNFVNSSSLAYSNTATSAIPTAKKQEVNFKLAQLIYNVKRQAKLLIFFKQDDCNYFYALEQIKDCSIAPTTKQVQTKTVYENDNSLSKFLQANFKTICKTRFLEKPNSLLCLVEVEDRVLDLPVRLNLQWLDFRDTQQHLQATDREDFQALLLRI